MITWDEIVAEAEARLAAADIAEPATTARWIGRQATGTDATEWFGVADQPATERQLAAFDRMIERRCQGEPLQYVLGAWGFRTLDLFVDRRVLIPRPETEIIAEAALAEFDRLTARFGDRPVVADLGTGSGAIGLAMALERPGSEIWLTDASADALAVARANLAGIGRAGGSVVVAEGEWYAALPERLVGRIGLVVSNPPYVSAAEDLEPQVAAWEPMSALLADDEGTADLRHILDRAPRWLRPGGAVIVEMAPNQIDSMVELAERDFSDVETIVDLAGRRRGLVARAPET